MLATGAVSVISPYFEVSNRLNMELPHPFV